MVVFGPQIFSSQTRGGISRGFVELFRAGYASYNWDLVVNDVGNIHLVDLIREDRLAAQRIYRLPQQKLFHKKPTDCGDLLLSTFNPEGMLRRVVHHTYYRSAHVKARFNIHTLHDLCDEYFKEKLLNFQQRLRSRAKLRALECADAIICVSNATRQALEEFRPDLARRSYVIHHGVRRAELWSNARPIERPYFLFVGKRGGYKNFATIARAFAASAFLASHSLVCFGGEPHSKEELEFLNQLSIADRTVFIGGDDRKLMTYYRHATAFLYPSFYEGFGLPLLEAMMCGCPIISANATSLPEVGGDVPIYAGPFDKDAWVEAMERVASGQLNSGQLKTAANAQLSLFSWEKTAALHNDIYSQF